MLFSFPVPCHDDVSPCSITVSLSCFADRYGQLGSAQRELDKQKNECAHRKQGQERMEKEIGDLHSRLTQAEHAACSSSEMEELVAGAVHVA